MNESEKSIPAISTAEALDTVRRRLIAIHYSLAEATDADREARAWALREMMSLIGELAPYRQPRTEAKAEEPSQR